MSTGVFTPASLRILAAASTSGASPYTSEKESFWPVKPGGTMEYAGVTVPS
jgi:hypothetical protein